MKMTGEYRIEAPRETVWAALGDPEMLRLCIPGCEALEKASETEFSAKIRAKVGPVSAKFAGTITLSDLVPPESYAITGEGKGGAAGFVKGGARVRLTEDRGATVLSYQADGQVGGKLAQIGQRLIDGTARKMADEFFGKFAEVVGAPAVAAAGVTAKTAPTPSSAAGGLPLPLWILGTVLAVIVLLAIFGLA